MRVSLRGTGAAPAAAPHQARNRAYDAAVLNLDIAPTVAALAGMTPPVPVDATSLAAWLARSPPPLRRDTLLLEYWRGNRGDVVDYSDQVTDGDQVEPYDLAANLSQLDNRAADPAFAATRASLALRLEDLLR